MDQAVVDARNAFVLERLARYLDETPAAITPELMAEMTEGLSLSPEEAYAQLLCAFCGLDPGESDFDRALLRDYFLPMVRALDADAFAADPYYRSVRVPAARLGRWEFREQRYAPYEAFVCGDLQALPDGRMLPHIGFFPEGFGYPALLEDGREWMLITPNEIVTMRPAIRAARGRVLAYGLGMGYFAYMASNKDEVTAVTVVERDPNAIRLFEAHILPQFPRADKLEIVRDDAFRFAEARMGAGGYDVVFTDLWHDPADGLDLYRRMKALEAKSPGSAFYYWIEDTLKCYLPREG